MCTEMSILIFFISVMLILIHDPYLCEEVPHCLLRVASVGALKLQSHNKTVLSERTVI